MPNKNNNPTQRTPIWPAPLAVRTLRLAIRLLASISPALAGAWVYRLWFRARRHPEPPQETAWRETAQALAVSHRGRPLAVHAWGAGPTVLLIHGWNGRGAQLGAFAAPLTNAGFRAVAFDTPAHGRSPGQATDIPEINEAIQAVAAACGPVHAVIGHSFGAACALYAVRHGLKVERLVAIAPPARMRGLARKFFDVLAVPTAVQAVFQHKLEARFGADVWQRFSPEALARRLDVPGLVVHDQDDIDMPWQEGWSVARAWPGAQFVRTAGLGHRRILRDPEVLARVTAFIVGEH